MQNNDIHYIAIVLDPRIKCQWICKNVVDEDLIISRIRKFLKATYPSEPELPSHDDNHLHRSFEYRFLEEFEIGRTTDDLSDIDRYLDTPPIVFKLSKSDNQTQWILN
jgi:hypothetical protein